MGQPDRERLACLVPVLRAALIPLLVGWGAALGFGLLIAGLQYLEVAQAFPTESHAAEFWDRVERLLLRGGLLPFVQVGLVVGVLAWQVRALPRRAALASALLLALVQAALGLWMGAPLIGLAVMALLLIGAAWYAALPRAA